MRCGCSVISHTKWRYLRTLFKKAIDREMREVTQLVHPLSIMSSILTFNLARLETKSEVPASRVMISPLFWCNFVFTRRARSVVSIRLVPCQLASSLNRPSEGAQCHAPPTVTYAWEINCKLHKPPEQSDPILHSHRVQADSLCNYIFNKQSLL